ncbi:hypothetical protein [Streptomyces sp. LN245]|uniref:hypothetical protein n=1 Tax=Streptomyces sp. LN245 TaxID=3112975 RepID=UPI00371EE208
MSNVTDLFVIIGDSGTREDATAAAIAPRVAEIVWEFIRSSSESPDASPQVPVISTARDDSHLLQGGPKPAGGAVIWAGWNYARPTELEERLKAEGFRNITVWTHNEHDMMDGLPPRVVSW